MTDIANMKMTPRHYYIVFVASLGQMIGTSVATLAGIIIPMLNIIQHPELSSFMQGLIGAADLIGIIFGSVIFGRLSDRYGYLFFFRFCPALILVASIAGILFPSVATLTICLFLIGMGIGGEYSLDSDYISELMPARYRSLMVGVAKAGCALGNILVAAICFGLLSYWESAELWPDLLWIVAITAALMILLRIRFYQSPKWLMDKGRVTDAEDAARKFFGPDASIACDSDAGSHDRPDTKISMGMRRYGSLRNRCVSSDSRDGTRTGTLFAWRESHIACNRFSKNHLVDQLHYPAWILNRSLSDQQKT